MTTNGKIAFVLCLWMICGISAKSQTISPESVHVSGGEFNAGGVKMSLSVGLLAVETITGNGYTLTQGYQQGGDVIVSVPETNYPDIPKVYPNPFREAITIAPVKGHTVQSTRLFNMQGQLMWMNLTSFSNNREFDLPDLPGGMYILEIIDNSERSIRYTLAKTN
jgi:hypothetical protein